jgi:hypothetical protein
MLTGGVAVSTAACFARQESTLSSIVVASMTLRGTCVLCGTAGGRVGHALRGRIHRCLRCGAGHPVLLCPENVEEYTQELHRWSGKKLQREAKRVRRD